MESLHFGRIPQAHAMKLAFTKMEGAGNDFVVVDSRTRP